MSATAPFAGRVALVTGAARGIGRATAEQFAQQGAGVALLDRNSEEVEAAADAIRQAGGDAIALAGDVADPASLTRAVAACADKWGRLDVLVNNAGIHFARAIDEYSDDEIDRIVSVNLKGALHAVRASLPCAAEGAGVDRVRVVDDGPRRPGPRRRLRGHQGRAHLADQGARAWSLLPTAFASTACAPRALTRR